MSTDKTPSLVPIPQELRDAIAEVFGDDAAASITHCYIGEPAGDPPAEPAEPDPFAAMRYWDDLMEALKKLCPGEPDDTGPKATFELYEREGGKSLTKTYARNEHGELRKDVVASIDRGTATKVSMTMGQFATFLHESVKSNQAASYGLFAEDNVAVRTKDAFERMARRGRSFFNGLPIRSRSRDHMEFSDGVSIFMIDVDKPDDGPALDWAQIYELLRLVMPGLLDAPMVIGNSASSYIYNAETGAQLVGHGGMRFYFLVANGTDIPRVGKVLQQRLWLHGYGYFKISAAGHLLPRTPFDAMVYQPERLDFIAGAKCGDGLKQSRPPAFTFNEDADPLDTRSIVQDLTDDEAAEFERIKATLRDEYAPAAAQKRAEWLDAREGEYMAKCKETDPAARAAAARRYREELESSLEGGELHGDFVLTIVERGHKYQATVNEILSDPKRFNRKDTTDPFDANYDDGRPVGRLFLYGYQGPRLYAIHRDANYLLFPSPEEPAPQYTPEERARATWDLCEPVDDTPAEIYLSEVLKLGSSKSPDCFRFLAEECALATAATGKDGEIVAVELRALTEGGGPSDRKFGQSWDAPGRNSVGAIFDGVVKMETSDERLCICWRLADAIAAYRAGFSAWFIRASFTLDRLAAFIERGRPIALCPYLGVSDQDKSTARRAAKQLASRLQLMGHQAAVVLPDDYERKARGLSDLLTHKSADPVRWRLDKFMGAQKPVEMKFAPLDHARAAFVAELGDVMSRYAGQRLGDDGRFAPALLYKQPPGFGKSDAYRKCLPDAVSAAKAYWGQFDQDRRIAISVPYHRLGEETVDHFAEGAMIDEKMAEISAAGINVASYRSRMATQPNSTEPMCANLVEISAAFEAGVTNMGKAVCKKCDFKDGCAFWEQKAALDNADVVVLAQANMWQTPPGMVGDFALNIVDESPIRAALVNADEIRVADLIDPETMPYSDESKRSHRDIRGKLYRAVEETLRDGGGPIRRSTLLRHGITEDDARDAANKFELERIIDDHENWSRCRPNKNVEPMRRCWRCVKDTIWAEREISTWLTVYRDTRTGEPTIKVRGYSELEPKFRVPTILLDATANVTLLKKFWRGVRFGRAYDIEMPHARIYQIDGRSFSKTSHAPALSEPTTAKAKAEEARKAELRAKLNVLAANIQRVHGGTQMLVSNKGTIEAFDVKGREGVLTGHFGALVGRNDFKNAASAVIIGRGPVPPVAWIEEQVMALTGREIEPIGSNWLEHDSERLVRGSDGGYHKVPCRAPYHPDKMCQALFEEHAHAEIEQAAHRLRLINRTAKHQAVVVIASDLDLRLPIDGLVSLHEVENPSLRDRMLAEGGVAFDGPAAAAKFYPPMFGTADAAKKAFERDASRPFGDIPPYLYITGECPSTRDLRQPADGKAPPQMSAATIARAGYAGRLEGARRFSFRAEGEDAKLQTGEFDPVRVKNLRVELESVFGELAQFEIVEDRPSDPKPKKPTVSRQEYEANSLSRTRPWEAEGISRRTWERRRACKAEQPAQSEQVRLVRPEPTASDGSRRFEVWEGEILLDSFRVTLRAA